MDHDAETEVLARRVADHLDRFRVTRREHVVNLVGPRGQRLWIGRWWRRPDRVWVSGEYPPGGDCYGLGRHEITVAVSRGPQVIAREITRRLLPAYEPDLATAQERITKSTVDTAARTRIAEELGETVPGGRVSENGHEAAVHWYGDPSGSIRLSGDGHSARIELWGVDVELTRRIADAVAGAAVPDRTTSKEDDDGSMRVR